ncbi:MAG: ANTAR domain-containing protein [Bacillota bacterium]
MNELRCIIGGQEINYPYPIEDFLTLEGHAIISKQLTARGLRQSALNMHPDIIIINTSLEGENIIELCKGIHDQKIAPIVIVGTQIEISKFSPYLKDIVFGFLVAPVTRDNLIAVLEVAYSKFQYIMDLEKKIKAYEEQVNNRILIEKAKGLLMKNKNLCEDEAYKMLRKISMDQCISMQRVAKAIIKKLG